MAIIVGASQYLTAATLANKQGLAPSVNTVLSQETTVASVLSASRNAFAVGGIGISSTAREINEQFLNRTSLVNEMFSLGIGSGATLEGLAQEIMALRASMPDDKLAPSLRGQSVDTTDEEGNSISATNQLFGNEVDTEA